MKRTRPLPQTVNSRANDSAWDASRFRALVGKAEVRPEVLAVAAGVSAATVVRWMTGRTCPSLVEAQHVADVLGVTAVDLLADRRATGSAGGGSGKSGKH